MTTETEQYLHAISSLGIRNAHAEFLLKHGRAGEPDAGTFTGWTGEPKNCFGNAAMLVLTRDPDLIYVEGYVTTVIAIHHAWCMRADGTIVDPTLRLDERETTHLPRAYFGVPFRPDFLRRFLLKVQTFGLLDGMSKPSINLMVGKTKPKSFLWHV